MLFFSTPVTHLGHILTSTLDDSEDIARVLKDLIRKAISVLCTFHRVDPFVKTFLIKSYILPVSLRCLHLVSGCKTNRQLEIGFNKILRKIWHLPRNSHSGIAHCVAHMDTIKNVLYISSVSVTALFCFFITIVHGLFLLSLHFMFLLLLVTTVCMVPNKLDNLKTQSTTLPVL
jgi:hypothetical protein